VRKLAERAQARILRSAAGAALIAIALKVIQARDAKRLATLASPAPKLHLGCGPHSKPGWVNIDAWSMPQEAPRGAGVTVINYDLTRGLPLADDVCSEIYSSHFLEHLSAREGASLLADCYRVLQPEGRLRTCLPDFSRLAHACVAGSRHYSIARSTGAGIPASTSRCTSMRSSSRARSLPSRTA
jgi:hypothetical protein